MSARRTKIEIIHDILTSIQQKGGKIKPTHLLYKSNLSHKKMMEYLGELMAKKMVEEMFEGKDKKYIITEEGLKYIFEFKKIKEFTDSFGL
ncbi:transcriptional regulator [Candidatus Woesearchaeota archaeon]|nr:transcriptional regulator [Candidatus Woesearchaeota archaeon]